MSVKNKTVFFVVAAFIFGVATAYTIGGDFIPSAHAAKMKECFTMRESEETFDAHITEYVNAGWEIKASNNFYTYYNGTTAVKGDYALLCR